MQEKDMISSERKKLSTSSGGAVLLVTLLFLLLLTFLGSTSLYLSFSETLISKNMELDVSAFYRGEAGIAWALYWFNNPSEFSGSPKDFFAKRKQGHTSYFDKNGISQYTGTVTEPDMVISSEDFVVKIVSPFTPGAICSVESTGIAGRMRKIIKIELFEDKGSVRILPGSWRVE